MRWLALLFALSGCHAATTAAPAAGGLVMHVALATAPTDGDVAIASASLHFGELVAVSDRSAADPRAAMSESRSSSAIPATSALPAAPPGIYSAVDTRLGTSAVAGLDVQGVWNGVRLHATLRGAPFDVACATTAGLEPGRRVELTLRADPAGWFDGVDLGLHVERRGRRRHRHHRRRQHAAGARAARQRHRVVHARLRRRLTAVAPPYAPVRSLRSASAARLHTASRTHARAARARRRSATRLSQRRGSSRRGATPRRAAGTWLACRRA